jgi:hypothetical protein
MRRRKDPFEKPWVIIAAVVGIIAVIVIALAFFMGGGSSAPEGATVQPSATSTNPSAQQTMAVGVAPSKTITQKPVTVPGQGVFVKVSYLGSFAGSYGMEGNMTDERNSGSRVYPVENATGTVSATFHKEDSSRRQTLIVEIWNDGKARKVAENSSSFGEASVTYTI